MEGATVTLYTAAYRDDLRARLVAAARDDGRISGAALTGSASVDGQDRWSDIDLFFGLARDADLPAALADWTARMYDEHEAVHHFDMHAGGAVYRVFLLRNTLQVDLAFAPPDRFAPRGPTFRLLFGTPGEGARAAPRPDVEELAGLGWLYALHARACLKRGQLWRAAYMVAGMRDQALAMACARHGLPTVHARGVDRLPAEVTAPLEASFVRGLAAAEVGRALAAAMQGLQAEIAIADPDLSRRVGPTLDLLVSGGG